MDDQASASRGPCGCRLGGVGGAVARPNVAVLERDHPKRKHDVGAVPRLVSPPSMTRAITLTVVIALIAAAAIYLHDPPWVGDLTYGFRPWDTDAHGERFRWTRGRGSFFVPSDATGITLKFRSRKPLPPKPVPLRW